MNDRIVMRTGEHSRVCTMAEHSTVPVINALTDDFHPCPHDACVLLPSRLWTQDAYVRGNHFGLAEN